MLQKFKWAERKCGPEVEGKWGTIVLYEMIDGPQFFKDPTSLTIYLDRLDAHQKEHLKGYLYIHGPLNSYLGFMDEPWCEHFDHYHKPWAKRSETTKKNIEEYEKQRNHSI